MLLWISLIQHLFNDFNPGQNISDLRQKQMYLILNK